MDLVGQLETVIPQARKYAFTTGIQTAAVTIGGTETKNSTEEYDGTSWTAGGTKPLAADMGAVAGTQTAALYFGGQPNPNATQKYDGTSWTTGGNMAVGRRYLSGSGTQTAGLAFGGYQPAKRDTEEFNPGTSLIVAGVTTS